MKLTEAEMRIAYQIESTNQASALQEVHTKSQYAADPSVKDASASLLAKLQMLPDSACMDVIREVQRTYHLPDKARTVGEMLAEARQQSGAQKLDGHDIMALERFAPNTRHMIVFDVLSHTSPVGFKGDKMRLFLSEEGYKQALESQKKGEIKIRNHAKVSGGHLRYDHKDHDL